MADRYTITQAKFLSDQEADYLELLSKKCLATKSRRDGLLILMGLRTGARASELFGINRQDFCKGSHSVLIRGLKGSNDREIPIPRWLSVALSTYCSEVEHDRIFDISYHRLYQIWMNFRPAKKTFHSLRHTFAIRVYMKTRDIKLTQVALGHRSINNTMVYLDYVYSLTELKKIIY